jgi:lipid-A-disaccharide synthase
LYAGALAAEIRRLEPSAEIFGLGGERLRRAGGRLIGDYRGLAVTGLAEALSVLPRSLTELRRLSAAVREERPDVVVPIDFPDFNFRLAARVKALGVPIVYYVAPQVWAWRPKRIETLRRLADRVLVIFPFEEEIYRRAGIPVEFVGHPLVDLAERDEPRGAFLASHGLDASAPTVAILPGSRPNEVRAILPGLTAAARIIAERVPGSQFLVARAPNLEDGLFEPAVGHPAADREGAHVSDAGSRIPIRVVESRTDAVLASSDVVLTASGTATVQAALHERPMVIVYRLSPWTYRLGRPFVQVDTYGMVNLIAGERIVPELIQDAFTAEAVAAEAVSFLTDRERADRTKAALRRIKASLGQPGASARAAQAVLRVAAATSVS